MRCQTFFLVLFHCSADHKWDLGHRVKTFFRLAVNTLHVRNKNNNKNNNNNMYRQTFSLSS